MITGLTRLRRVSFGIAAGLLLSSGVLSADVKLPAIFSDHMVLKADENVPLWGKADPGEEVTVSMNGQTVKATAGADGKWKVLLNLKGSQPGPFEMTVSGKNTLKISDVVVGEVWLASGQSNMYWKLNVGEYTTVGGAEEVARSANPMLRMFEVRMAHRRASPGRLRGFLGHCRTADHGAIFRGRLLLRQKTAERIESAGRTYRRDGRRHGSRSHGPASRRRTPMRRVVAAKKRLWKTVRGLSGQEAEVSRRFSRVAQGP